MRSKNSKPSRYEIKLEERIDNNINNVQRDIDQY